MILIDGYNLLHAAEVISRGVGPGTLERARNALLNALATSLDEDDRRRTTVVFDSHNAPPGLPREVQHQGMCVKYAAGYESADEMLEELIRQSSAPRRLTVVSSDHRVQRAAKRRRARAVDSDVWYAEIREDRRQSNSATSIPRPKPIRHLSEDDVAAWLDEFGDIDMNSLVPSKEARTNKVDAADESPAPVDNPFPPGYAEDLLDE
jgi:uncharacterized protein